MIRVSNKLLWLLLPALLALGAYTVWQRWQQAGPGPGFVSGNGRLEATEIDIATKTAGRLLEVLVCPVTRGKLTYDRERQELVSKGAKLAFPIREGVPIMLPEEARALD